MSPSMLNRSELSSVLVVGSTGSSSSVAEPPEMLAIAFIRLDIFNLLSDQPLAALFDMSSFSQHRIALNVVIMEPKNVL